MFDPGSKWWKLFKPGKNIREGCFSFIANHLKLCYFLTTLKCLPYHLVSLSLNRVCFCGAQKDIGDHRKPDLAECDSRIPLRVSAGLLVKTGNKVVQSASVMWTGPPGQTPCCNRTVESSFFP